MIIWPDNLIFIMSNEYEIKFKSVHIEKNI